MTTEMDVIHTELFDRLQEVAHEFEQRMPPYEFMFGVARFGMFGLLIAAKENTLLAFRTINSATEGAIEMFELLEKK